MTTRTTMLTPRRRATKPSSSVSASCRRSSRTSTPTTFPGQVGVERRPRSSSGRHCLRGDRRPPRSCRSTSPRRRLPPFAATVDDANVADRHASSSRLFGAKDTGDCMRRRRSRQRCRRSPRTATFPVEFDVNVSNEGNLGIGDHSAALSFEAVDGVHGADHPRADVVFAQVGNDIVGVSYIVAGDPQSDFDARAELQMIVDSLESVRFRRPPRDPPSAATGTSSVALSSGRAIMDADEKWLGRGCRRRSWSPVAVPETGDGPIRRLPAAAEPPRRRRSRPVPTSCQQRTDRRRPTVVLGHDGLGIVGVRRQRRRHDRRSHRRAR